MPLWNAEKSSLKIKLDEVMLLSGFIVEIPCFLKEFRIQYSDSGASEEFRDVTDTNGFTKTFMAYGLMESKEKSKTFLFPIPIIAKVRK